MHSALVKQILISSLLHHSIPCKNQKTRCNAEPIRLNGASRRWWWSGTPFSDPDDVTADSNASPQPSSTTTTTRYYARRVRSVQQGNRTRRTVSIGRGTRPIPDTSQIRSQQRHYLE